MFLKVRGTLVAGWVESSVCPQRAAHGGTVKYERVLMNRTAEPQFTGAEKLHLRQIGKHLSCPVFLRRSCRHPRTKLTTRSRQLSLSSVPA